MKRRILCLLLAAAMLLGLSVTALAGEPDAQCAAESLYQLGLFNGTGTYADGSPKFELDRAPTRFEAVTMLVRLLGKEDEAKNSAWTTPFTDLEPWAAPYVGYAYANQLTNGTGSDRFGGKETVTAAQYLTFVLRALGYRSGEDFVWSRAWELTDRLGLTAGRYHAQTTRFLRGDVALISCNALNIACRDSDQKLYQTLGLSEEKQALAASFPVTPLTASEEADGSFTVDASGAVPAETGAARLSSAQLEKLRGASIKTAANTITTLADAYIWLAQEGYSTTGINGLLSPANSTAQKAQDWLGLSTTLNLLLEGDYDEVGTLYCAVQTDDPGWDFLYISFNYVKTGSWYYITDPNDHLPSTGYACCRARTIRASSLAVVKDALVSGDGGKVRLLMMAALPLTTTPIQLRYEAEPESVLFVTPTNAQVLYQANAEALAEYQREQAEKARAEAERWERQAPSLRISSYGMPDAIGNTTLSYEQAKALVGQEPEKIAESVKTVGDVLQYMIAARFGYNAPGVFTPWYDDWGYDAPGDDQLRQNYGCCCGGYANTVSYLLEGDYDKVGTLRWVGGGNHTISWVMTGGKYYVFDFTQYCSGGHYNNFHAPVTVLDRLEDYYDKMPSIYSKKDVVIMVAFEAGKAMYPSQWNDPPQFSGLTFPKEADGSVIVIYQADPACGVRFRQASNKIPRWPLS